MFSVGYNNIRDKVAKGNVFVMSCENCLFFRADSEDLEEYCQNSSVSEYDMVVEGNRVSCLQWVSYSHGENVE